MLQSRDPVRWEQLLDAVINGDDERVATELAEPRWLWRLDWELMTDSNGRTVLHHAAIRGHHKVVELLVADVDSGG